MKSQPRGKCCYSHCMCEIFAQLQASRSLSVKENSSELDSRLPRNFRDMNWNSALSAELRSRHKDHKGKLKDEWKSVTRPPLMTSL